MEPEAHTRFKRKGIRNNHFDLFVKLVHQHEGTCLFQEQLISSKKSRMTVMCKRKHVFTITMVTLEKGRFCPVCHAMEKKDFMIARKIELERMQDEIRRKQEEKLKQERIKFMKNLDKNCTITSDPSEHFYSCTNRERLASYCTSEESDDFVSCLSSSNSFASLDSLQ